MQLTKILCLDMDGTVRRSKSGKIFIEGPDDIEIIPGMKERILHYQSLGYLVMGVTNQGGVAHSLKPYKQISEENHATAILLGFPDDVIFEAIYYCPYHEKGNHPDFAFRSLHRKPYIGMLCQIESDLINAEIIPDWDNSLFVGDRPEDEQCAKTADIPFMWAHDFLKTREEEDYKTTQQSEGAGWESGRDPDS